MAHKNKSKKKSSHPESVTSSPAIDAGTLALYRWYIVTTEKVLLEAHATSPENSAAFIKAMRKCIKEIYAAGRKPKRKPMDEGCADGYECCKDGLCAPMCTYES